MKYFETLFTRKYLQPWLNHYQQVIPPRIDPKRHGDLPQWLDILDSLPHITSAPLKRDLNQKYVTIGEASDFSCAQLKHIRKQLMALAPWRKGPFNIAGIHIDSEWRSDWKWQRLAPHIKSLNNKNILDVGGGNGYHAWRMLGQKAAYVQVIDPSPRFWLQHLTINHFAQEKSLDFLPIAMEDMPKSMRFFDTIFSMGVLYHRREPTEHIQQLKMALKPRGELVLETLIVDADYSGLCDGIFTPENRYAQMRNVWSLLSLEKIVSLLEQNGFSDIRCVDINQTSTLEQRQTQWMQFHSLQQFLNPDNQNETIEGLPAPKRAIIIAQAS